MNRRAKILAVVVAVIGGVFVGDKLLFALFVNPNETLSKQIRAIDNKLSDAKTVLSRRASVTADWKDVKALLAKPRTPDVQNHFYTHLDGLSNRVGANPDIQGGAPQKQGEFREYVYEMRLKLTWPQFVDLIRELHNSPEFLKPVRINVVSRYEKEQRLDLDLRVSTIASVNGNGHAEGTSPEPPARPAVSADALKALRENNIFSPYRPKPVARTAPSTTDKKPATSTTTYARGAKPPVVTGIIFDPEGGDHRVIVEDRNSSTYRKFDKPKFLKAGDELLGFTIESVSPEKVVLKKDEETKELNLGDSFPSDGSVSVGSGGSPSSRPEIKQLDDATRTSVLERLRSKLKKKRSYDDEP